MERADEPEQEGNALNKTNLLKDETAALFGLSDEAVPDEALVSVALLTGAGEPTETTPGAIGQCYYDTDAEVFYKCVLHIVDGGTTSYMWAKMGSGNAAAFGTRGPVIIRDTQTLDLSQYGLKVGDKVNVICIGGGGGGGGRSGYKGGAAGSGGTASGGGGGGAGGGYGAGGGGAGGADGQSYSTYGAGGGGGSGYLNAKTIVLTSTSVAVTIGAAGAGGTAYDAVAGSGGTTSFGSFLSAAGGGGAGSTNGPQTAGVGARNGGKGGSVGIYTTNYGGGGGGGAGGWLVEGFTVYSASDGEDGEKGASTSGDLSNGYYGGKAGNGGSDGYDGGARGVDGKSNPLGGKGAVIFWY